MHHCPHCGADIGDRKLNVFINCEFCKNPLYVSSERVSLVYTYESRIDAKRLAGYLSRDIHEPGTTGDIEIISSVPLYLPFWGKKEKAKLARGSYQFPDENIESLPGTKVFFQMAEIENQGVEILDVDIAAGTNSGHNPGNKPGSQNPGDSPALYYLPFYKIAARIGDRYYYYFLNAVNGNVIGAKKPHRARSRKFKLFPLFFLAFILFFLNNFLIVPITIVMPLNVLLLAGSYYVSRKLLEKETFLEKR